MRLIDAEPLHKALIDHIKRVEELGFSTTEARVLLFNVDNAPTIEAEPVVRCKDCEHRILNEHYGEKGYINLKAMCEYDTGDPFELARCAEDDNWFCADGKKKEADDA